MIDLHKFTDSELICRILAIDNGTDKVGFTIADYNIRTGRIKIILCETFEVPSNYRVANRRVYNHRGSLMARLDIIGDYYSWLLSEYQPEIVGCESPFGGRRMLNAFRTLTISMQQFDDIAFDLYPWMDFIKVSPFEAKKAAAGEMKFSKDKDVVHRFLFKDERIDWGDEIDPRTLGPDALDSVTVALAITSYVLY